MEHNNNLPMAQKHAQDLALLEQNKPYLLTLKENEPKWKLVTANEKENCLDFMLDILNIKIVTLEEQDEIDRQMILIADIINSHFSNLTPSEIKEAFKLYVSKKFPEVKVFRLVDCVAVGEILNAYIEYRNQSIEPFVTKRQNLLNAPIEKTQSEKENIFKEFVKMVFDEVKEKEFCAESWSLFQKLEEKGKISKSNEEKQELYSKELSIYVPEERKRIIEQYKPNFKPFLEEFEKTYSDGKRNRYVKNRCRAILASQFIFSEVQSYEELLTILK